MEKDKIVEMTKTCSICKTVKSHSEFYKMKKSTDGADTYCKKCRLRRNKRWVRKNKKKRQEYMARRWPAVRDAENAKRTERHHKKKREGK